MCCWHWADEFPGIREIVGHMNRPPRVGVMPFGCRSGERVSHPIYLKYVAREDIHVYSI